MARKSKVADSDLKVQIAAPSAALDKNPNPASSPPVTDARTGGRDDASQLRALLRASGVGLWDWDLVTNTVYFSPEWKRQLGYDDHELPNRFEVWEERLHPADIAATLAAVNDFREGRRSSFAVEFRLRHKDGSWRWILASGDCARDSSGVPVRMMGSHIDITQRKQTEALWKIQRDVLELIAAGVPLKQSLTTLARGLEAFCEGVICSVLLSDRDGVHLRNGAAPSLPESYNQAVDGIKIGPSAGSCGTAAFLRQQVIVEDIEHDPLWADYKALALSHGLRACWSTPIFDRQRTVLGTFAIYYRQQGLPTADHLQLIAMATDIAAIAIGRERTESDLRVSDTALRSISQGVVITSSDGTIQSVTPAYTAITGYDAADLLGQPCTLLMAGMDAQGVAAINKARESGESFAGEILDKRKDGTAYWNDLTLHPIRDEQGQLLHVVGVSRDVSERQRAQTALMNSQQRLAELINNLDGIVWEADAQTFRMTFVSHQAERILGYAVAEWVAEPMFWQEHIHPEDRDRVVRFCMKETRELRDHSFRYRMIAADGRSVWFDDRVKVSAKDGKPHLIHGVMVDITELKQAEAELSSLATILERTGEMARVGGWELDLLSGTLFWTREIYRIHELDPGTVPTVDTAIQYYAPEARPVIRHAVEAGIAHGKPWDLELPFVTAKGRAIWVRTQGSVVMEDGKAVRLMGAFQDITERKLVELTSARLAAIVDYSNDAILSRAMDRTILTWNAAAERMFGYSASEAIGQSASFIIPPDREAEAAEKRRLLDSTGLALPYDTVRITKSGQRVDVSITQSPIKNASGEVIGVSITFRDITARKQAEAARASLEAQLRESQKMEAIGTLAGGIAHDFNNIIAAILGNVDLATMDAEGQPPVLESLVEIRKASTRARDLVQRILSFSRRQPSERRMTSLVSVVDESVRLLRTVLPGRLTLEVACASDVPEVPADAHHLEQVILNLVTNAMQALAGEKGRIAIRLDTTVLDAALAQAQPALGALFARHAGRVVTLSVSDDGPGMDRQTMSRIFEPFFTTKSVGSGTGLGLSVVHGIVQEHDGAIVVESQLGKGATFTIYLPVIAASPSTDEPQPSAVHADHGNGVHILYLDDEAALVSVIKRVLERRGYRISGFTDQQQALDALRADAAAYDLVVSDYNMPDITGLDVARAVRDIRPDLPVVIATGFIDEVLRQQAGKAGVREFVSKAGATEGLTDAIERLAQSLVRASPAG